MFKSEWILVLVLARISASSPAGGKCTTSADCVAPNVCSKWGWCQWTKIYGERGPSQGASALSGGKAGQCVTSDDCASRVPYCSKLGFCHGGKLPFDEAQLEIVGSMETQGYINNDPSQNSPVFDNPNFGSSSGIVENSLCMPGGLEECIETQCVKIESDMAYQNCVLECDRSCPE